MVKKDGESVKGVTLDLSNSDISILVQFHIVQNGAGLWGIIAAVPDIILGGTAWDDPFHKIPIFTSIDKQKVFGRLDVSVSKGSEIVGG